MLLQLASHAEVHVSLRQVAPCNPFSLCPAITLNCASRLQVVFWMCWHHSTLTVIWRAPSEINTWTPCLLFLLLFFFTPPPTLTCINALEFQKSSRLLLLISGLFPRLRHLKVRIIFVRSRGERGVGAWARRLSHLCTPSVIGSGLCELMLDPTIHGVRQIEGPLLCCHFTKEYHGDAERQGGLETCK